MKTSEMFVTLLENLKLGHAATTIASRRDEITKALNKDFREVTGCTDHRLMVGSFGRHTAIRGISDLDMIFILPGSLRSTYSHESGPRRLLERVRDTLKARYPNTSIRVDRCVVRVEFTSNSFKFEVQPAFENDDGSFSYPDTTSKAWKITKPRAEIRATKDCSDRTSTNMRRLARMARSWKNTNGVNVGGLLIDTLVHNFFAQTTAYDNASTASFDAMCMDFFQFLKDEPDQDRYLALGSLQHVTVKARFQPKAKKAYNRCLEAISEGETEKANRKWREVFGNAVPLTISSANQTKAYDDTEQFIEDHFPVDIRETVSIDCEVTQNGFRPSLLRAMLRRLPHLPTKRKLRFFVKSNSVEQPYTVKWKVLDRGVVAERRNMIRGQVVDSNQAGDRTETSDFRGEHLVECYVIQYGVVVARDQIEVPIGAAES